MKRNEIRKLSNSELEKKLGEIQRELMVVRTKKSSGANPDNPGKVKPMRRDIARILTEQNRRTIETK